MNRVPFSNVGFLLFFILISTFSVSNLFSQDTTEGDKLIEIPDSLIEDRDRVDYMIMASWGSRLSDRNKSFQIGRMAIDSAKIKEVTDLEGLAYNLMGILFMQAIEYDSAEFYYSRAEETAIAIKDSGLITNVKLNRAKIALNTGNVELANQYGFEALEIFEQKKDTSGQAFALQTIGQNFLQMNEFERALPYLYRSLENYKIRSNPRRLATIYNDLGINYQELKNNDSALFYYQRSLEKREEINDLLGIPGSQMNIGLLMLDEKRYTEAKEILALAREGYDTMEDPKGVLNCDINLGLVAMEEKDYAQALKYYESAFKGATEIKNRERVSAAADYLSEAYGKLGRSKEAYDFLVLHKTLKDSLLEENKSREILELEAKYQTAKKDQELIQQKLEFQEEQARDTQIRRGLIGLFIGIILILALLYTRYQYRQRLKISQMVAAQQKTQFSALIEGEEKERKRIARELHDGLGQLLSSARMNVSLLNQEDEHGKNVYNTSISIIDEAVSEVRHISHNMMPAALMRLGLVPAIKDLTRKINGADSLKVTLTVDGLSDRLDESKEIAVYRIIQEIMNNVVRHSEATNATIDLLRANKQFFVEISDNGKGLAPDSIKNSKGIGWNNIQSRVSMLNGEMEIDSKENQGTKIDIQFPV